MPEYTVLAVAAVLAVVLVEVAWLRTGILRTPRFWITVALVFFFQVLVDGWLTKLSDPIVIYRPEEFLGIRFPWDIPIEDFGFGFALLTLTLLGWQRLTSKECRP